MRITYYSFPQNMSIRDVALTTIRLIEGRTDVDSIPESISDEVLKRNYERTIDTTVSNAKKLLKLYGGSAYTAHFDRDGGLFETTPINLKGNNSRHKYNRHL